MPTELVLRLRRVEERLERLLVSGWRNAGSEAADLAEEAAVLSELGLDRLAERLHAVASVAGGIEALRAATLAATTCRLLRTRLAAETPPGDWSPLGYFMRRQSAVADRLLLLGRMAIADGEAWICARLRGVAADEWMVLDTPPLPGLPGEPADGSLRLTARVLGPGQRAEGGTEHASSWFGRPVEGTLRWRGRYPLGASGEVQRCVLTGAAWGTTDASGEPVATLRKVLTESPTDDRPVLGRGLRLNQLFPAETDSYVWLDPATASVFRSVGRPVWALVWAQGGLTAPLVLIDPDETSSQLRLVHLVPGLPSEPLHL